MTTLRNHLCSGSVSNLGCHIADTGNPGNRDRQGKPHEIAPENRAWNLRDKVRAARNLHRIRKARNDANHLARQAELCQGGIDRPDSQTSTGGNHMKGGREACRRDRRRKQRVPGAHGCDEVILEKLSGPNFPARNRLEHRFQDLPRRRAGRSHLW